jgi:hypothetical protein
MAADIIEPIDRSHTQVTDKVDGRLKVDILLTHDDHDHVVIIPMRLLDIVGIQVLGDDKTKCS